MAFLRRKSGPSAVIAQALVVALLIGGLPLLSGVVIVGTHDGPAFTLNICHPLPGLDHGASFPAVPLVDGRPSLEKPSLYIVLHEADTPPLSFMSEAPDPPPPKSLG